MRHSRSRTTCFRKVDATASGCRLGYWIHQERRAVHILISRILRAHVVAEIHHQRTHRRIAVVRYFPRERIGVGQQAIAQTIEAHENFLRVRSVRPEFVLIGLASAVHTQDRVERAVLKPADEQLAIGGIVGIAGDEAADIGGPVRNAGEGKVQTGGNLAAEAEPVGIDVARPCGDSIALDPAKAERERM